MKKIIIGILIVAVLSGYYYIRLQYVTDEYLIWNTTDLVDRALSSGKIDKLDKYFIGTKFVYQDRTVNYTAAKKNLNKVVKENAIDLTRSEFFCDWIMYEWSSDEVSYPPNPISIDGNKVKCHVIFWIHSDIYYPTEVNITTDMIRLWPLPIWKITQVKSEDPLFGYMFIDHSINSPQE